MPIKVPNNLPARQTLEREGVMVMSEADAIRQDIRPLRIGMLNLMPDKIRTETQFARLCGSTPLQVEFTLLKMTGHTPKNTPADHMIAFYRDLSEVRDEKFDGMIVTGAPVELLEFEAVSYWPELVRFFDWTRQHVHSTFCICWAAQAALYRYYGIGKHRLSHKAFGVYRHKNLNPDLALSAGLFGRFLDTGVALDRGAPQRAAARCRARGADGIGRGRVVPGCGRAAPGALHVQPHRIRHGDAGGGILARHQQRQAHPPAVELLPA